MIWVIMAVRLAQPFVGDLGALSSFGRGWRKPGDSPIGFSKWLRWMGLWGDWVRLGSGLGRGFVCGVVSIQRVDGAWWAS